MNVYIDLCRSLGLPAWLASLLHAATRLRNDHARRKKVFRLLQRKLTEKGDHIKGHFGFIGSSFFNKVGVKEGDLCQPTYVYPKEVKLLIRSAFPKDICDYPDPCHDGVVYITVDDLHQAEIM